MSIQVKLARDLLAVAKAYRAVRGVSMATLSTEFYGDSTFFDRIAANGDFGVRTYDKVMGLFSKHWPEGAVWPPNIDRPAVKRGEATSTPPKRGLSAA